MTPRPGHSLTPTARLGIRALRTPRPWKTGARTAAPAKARSIHRWQARKPVPPPPRFLTLGSWLLAGAGVLGCVVVGLRVFGVIG